MLYSNNPAMPAKYIVRYVVASPKTSSGVSMKRNMGRTPATLIAVNATHRMNVIAMTVSIAVVKLVFVAPSKKIAYDIARPCGEPVEEEHK